MMSRLLAILCAVTLSFNAVCFAQGDSYKDQIDKMVAVSEDLSSMLDANTVDYASYDKWYQDFKVLGERFAKDFFNTRKQSKSFKSTREGIDGMSLAWSMLSQAKYADTQYSEFITSNDVAYAHKWKATATEQRKKAVETIKQAIESLKVGQDSAGED